MADLINKYVKFNVFGGAVLGKVILVHSEKFDFDGKSVEASKDSPQTIVELVSGQKTVIASKDLTVLTDEDYNKELLALIDDLCGKAKVDSVATYKGQVDKLTKELETSKAEVTKVSTEKDALATQLAESTKVQEASAKEVEKLSKEKRGSARFEELKTLEANDGIAKTKDDAVAKLGEMSDEVYAQVKQLASTAFQKLTDVRKTSEKALTEVTKTSDTKSTDATVKEVTLAEVKIEEDKDKALEQVSANADDGQALASFIGGLMTKNKGKKAKKS